MSEPQTTENNAPSRSPAYPFISLPKAIIFIEKLYAAEKRNATPLDILAPLWGYKPTSSGFIQSIAALKRYGLIDSLANEGNKKVRVTQLAMRIILGASDKGSDYASAIQAASSNPAIYRELWDNCRDASDANIKRKLVLEHNFTEAAADHCIRGFRETMALAQSVAPAPTKPLIDPGVIDAMDELMTGTRPDEAAPLDDSEIMAIKFPETKGSKLRQITLPVSGGTAVIRIPYPVSGESFDRLIKMLQLWKEELVEKKD